MAYISASGVRGNTILINLMVNKSGVAIPLDAAFMRFTAKRQMDDVAAVITKDTDAGIALLTGITGGAVVFIDPADTAHLDCPLVLLFDVELTEADGTVTTVAEGRLSLSPTPTPSAA